MSNSTIYFRDIEVYYQRQDRISKLSDDVIVSILSHMKLKDAVRTCILSNRWRYMWTNLADLKFDESMSPLSTNPHYVNFHPLRFIQKKFVNCVNQVVDSRREDMFINEFEISFELNRDHASHVDRWVKFAFSKRVRTLKLTLWPLSYSYPRLYTLGSCNLVKDLSFEGGMKFLTTLHLSSLNLSGEFLEFILSRCSLECLSIKRIFGLVRLRVKDSSSKLKYLKMESCYDLGELELDAGGLVCFEYHGERANIAFNYVPSIVQVNFSTYDLRLWPLHFWHFKSLSNQLIKLSLELHRRICGLVDIEGLSLDQDFPSKLSFRGFPSLKYLDLSLSDTWDNLLAWMSLATACPLLLEFKLKVEWRYLNPRWDSNEEMDEDTEDQESEEENKDYEMETDEDTEGQETEEEMEDNDVQGEYFGTKLEHWATQVKRYPLNTLPNLRSFELVGFIGMETDVQIVMHIAEAAPMLSRICLNTTPTYDGCSKHRRELYKERACILRAGFPSSIDVTVL